MHRPLFVLLLFYCAALLQAQPTPRPGRPLAAPVLLPRDGATASAQGKKMQGRNLDSTVMPAEKSPLALPLAAHVPEDAVQAPAVNEPVKKSVEETIEWLSIEEAVEKNKLAPRKILVDVYTDWCGWCKKMDQTTFKDPMIVKYVSETYYAVKFNAEQQKDIELRGKKYQFVRNGGRGYHELAAEWLNNRMGYPTMVFLDDEMNLIQPIAGFQQADKFDVILHYFGTNSHKTTPWETYERKYLEQRSE
jgi:thioredoxin-related protein